MYQFKTLYGKEMGKMNSYNIISILTTRKSLYVLLMTCKDLSQTTVTSSCFSKAVF